MLAPSDPRQRATRRVVVSLARRMWQCDDGATLWPMSPRTTLPAGNVTCLSTDIEGSTRLFQRLGEAYRDLLDAHTRVLRDVVERHRGGVVATHGDAVFAAFD